MTTPSRQVSDDERRRSQIKAIQASLDRAQARNIAAWAEANPTISAGAALTFGRAGIPPGSPAGQTAQRADATAKAARGGWSIGALVKKAGSVLGEVKDVVEVGTEFASRSAFGLLSAPGEALQQTVREAAAGDLGALNPLSLAGNLADTTIGQGIRQAVQGRDWSQIAGTGYFMEGTAAAAQREIARSTHQTAGHATTLGRFLTDLARMDPDSTAEGVLSGLVDAAVAISTDPSTWVAGPISRAREASKLFAGAASKGFTAEKEAAAAAKLGLLEQAGLVHGVRTTVVPARVTEWLSRGDGAKVVSYLAKEDDAWRLWKSTGERLDPKTVLALTQARSEPEVAQVLAPLLGTTASLGEKFGVRAPGLVATGLATPIGAARAKVLNRFDATRAFGLTPGRVLRKDDPTDAAKQLDRFMLNAKFDAAERSEFFTAFAATDDVDQWYDVVADVMTRTALKLRVDDKKARELTRIWSESGADLRTYWYGQLAEGGFGNKVFGEPEVLSDGTVRSRPHLANEFLNSHVPLPDHRDIRRGLSRYARLLTDPRVEVGRATLEAITEQLFKPLALLRPAYITRVGIDEQFRLAGVGLASMFSHPVQFLNWMLVDDGTAGRLFSKVGGHPERGALTVTGARFDVDREAVQQARAALDEAKRSGGDVAAAQQHLQETRRAVRTARPLTEAASRYQMVLEGGIGNWQNRGKRTLRYSRSYVWEHSGFSRALGEELHLIHNDPTGLGRRVARGDVYDGERVGDTEGVEAIKAWWFDGAGRAARLDLAKNGPTMAALRSREGADAYVDSVLARVNDSTGGVAELREAVVRGAVGGAPLAEGDTLEISAKALAELDRLKAAGKAPRSISGSTRFAAGEEGGHASIEALNKTTDFLFYKIAAQPSNKLARSPVFRQRYYQRAEQLMGFASRETQQQLVESARWAGLSKAQVRRFENLSQAGRSGRLTLDEVDVVAQGDALDFARELLYDLTTRNQFFDAARVIFPFGEAFKEAAFTYARIARERPQTFYRLGLGLQGGREFDPNEDGTSFFSFDPQTGQEVFNITALVPGAGPLMEQALGSQGFKAPVGGLNMMGTSVLPGVGPVVQIAAGFMLPDEAEYNSLEKLISPFGERDFSGGTVESFLPPWFNKLKTAIAPSPKQAKAFANAKRDMLAFLVSTGDYRMNTPEAMARTEREATKRAKVLFLLRGLAQSTAPSPPIPQMIAFDKTGRTLTQFKIVERYQQLRDEDPKTATERFLQEFGKDLALLMVPKATAADGTVPLPPTAAGREFRQQNPDTVDAHRRVVGLFLSGTEDADDFDHTEYQRQINTGERKLVGAQEAVRQANRRVAAAIYNSYVVRAGEDLSRSERDALRRLKEKLKDDYPGYEQSYSNTAEAVVKDVLRALADPVLAGTTAGQGAAVYARYREQAEQLAKARFGESASFVRGERTRYLRDALRELAARIGDDHVGFTDLFSSSFEREMTDD